MASHGYGEQEDRPTDWDVAYEMAHKEFNRLQAEHRTAVIDECLRALHFPYCHGEAAIGVEFARQAIRKLRNRK